MSDEGVKEGQQTPEEMKAAPLSDQDLASVNGGTKPGHVATSEIHFVKFLDKTTPLLHG